MPLVANTKLPTFERLKQSGEVILPVDFALEQEIRELHIGLLNMMPDAALEATERQFFRLIGESNQIAQFYVHPFSLSELDRGEQGRAHIDKYYSTFDQIKQEGLDALIITGANVSEKNLSDEKFWQPLSQVVQWAFDNVTSTLFSCLATHAVLEFQYNQKRSFLGDKRWGVFTHRLNDQKHPLVSGVNTRFDVPHSRFNEIFRQQFLDAGLKILAESDEAGVHLAVSADGFRQVFFQGHPEYDAISLMKEYKREVRRFINKEIEQAPIFPDNYLSLQNKAVLDEYIERISNTQKKGETLPEFPENLIISNLDNTWHDTAEAVINNWIGKVYQLTNKDRKLPFMSHVKPENPLGL